MRGSCRVLFLLPVLFCFFMFSGCASLLLPFDNARTGKESTPNTETTKTPANTDSIDDIFAGFLPAGMASDRAVIKTRTGFLALYSGDQLSQEQLVNKASQIFTDAFFESNFLVIIRSKLPYQFYFLNAISLLERDNALNIGLRIHRAYDELQSPLASFDGHIILVLQKAYFSSDTVNVSYLNREYQSEAELNRDIATGVLFAESQFEAQRGDKRARDFQTLEKYMP